MTRDERTERRIAIALFALWIIPPLFLLLGGAT